MQITLVQGLLIALVVFICACDKHMEAFMWFRPLVVAFFTGIILGDVSLGLQAGAVAELSYPGLADCGRHGTPGPPVCRPDDHRPGLHHGQRCEYGPGPGWIGTATNTLYAGFLPGVDRDAAAGNERGVARRMYTGWFIYAFLFALAAFLSVYAFQSGISTFVASFPEWLVHGFEVAGGLMPAVGLALLLVVMLKKENVAYLLAGFVIMVITNCSNILPVAVLAGAIAFVNFNRDVEMSKMAAAVAAPQEGEFEDGI